MKNLIFLIMLAVIVLGPMLSIWSVNLLFGTNIPITLETWFAALWIGTVVSGTTPSITYKEEKKTTYR